MFVLAAGIKNWNKLCPRATPENGEFTYDTNEEFLFPRIYFA